MKLENALQNKYVICILSVIIVIIFDIAINIWFKNNCEKKHGTYVVGSGGGYCIYDKEK